MSLKEKKTYDAKAAHVMLRHNCIPGQLPYEENLARTLHMSADAKRQRSQLQHAQVEALVK